MKHPQSSAHYTGAANEHRVSTWFLQQGVQVYWPACQQTEVDFVVDMPGQGLKKVQVKTATWNRSSPPWAYLQCRTRLTNKYQDAPASSLYDYLAIVCPSHRRLWVIPSTLVTSSNLCLDGDRPGRTESVWKDYERTL